jgi:hypothetical protein
MDLKVKTLSAISAAVITLFIIQGCHQPESEIVQVVNNQLKRYPESTLQDIYKSFFQDEFGAGHLAGNVSIAREYFDLELEEMESRGRRDAEPCGAGRNFYRVPMDLVKDGLIPAEDYFTSFMESSSGFKIPDIKVWKTRWGQIEAEIEKMDLQIPNMERDKKFIYDLLDRGEAAVHHSDRYRNKYDPHYRIMGKEQWEQLKGSFLNN